MKIKLPDKFKKEDSVVLIDIYKGLLIIVNKSDFNPEPILKSSIIPKERVKNVYRVINANSHELKVVNGTATIPYDFDSYVLKENEKSLYIINAEVKNEKTL